MDAVLLAAGKSERMGEGLEKQLVRIGGKPMLVFSLEKLLANDHIGRVIITCPAGRCDEIEAVVAEYDLGPCVFVQGGETRHESAYFALQHVQTDRVLIHEAARPLVSRDLIARVLDWNDEPAVVPTTPLPFTASIGDEYMEDELDRSRLHNIQLPQAFDAQILRSAHEKARQAHATATEDSMLVFRLGHKVRFVQGDLENIKITWPVDLIVAKALIFGDRDLS